MPGYVKPEVLPSSPSSQPVPRSTSQTSQVTYPGGYGVQPRDPSLPSNRPIINPYTGRPKSPEPDGDPSGIDASSVKKHFGWATIANINVPVLFRASEKHTSVRIVEDKFLKHFPSTFSQELGNQPPLISYYLTPAEAKLLNEINSYHCNCEYGRDNFTENDLIVKVTEFTEFLNVIKLTFPDEVIEARKLGIPLPKPSELRNSACGWIQVNNTISPYIRRDKKKYVISNVMRHAAQLPLTSQHEEYLPTDEECQRINKLCISAGFDFQFGPSTKFISLDEMRSEHRLKVVELPPSNPRDYAKYTENNNDMHKKATATNHFPQPSRKDFMLTRPTRPMNSGSHISGQSNSTYSQPINKQRQPAPARHTLPLTAHGHAPSRYIPTTSASTPPTKAPKQQSTMPLLPANYLPHQQVVQTSNNVKGAAVRPPSGQISHSYVKYSSYNQPIGGTAAPMNFSVSNMVCQSGRTTHMTNTSFTHINHTNAAGSTASYPTKSPRSNISHSTSTPHSTSQALRMKHTNNGGVNAAYNANSRHLYNVQPATVPTSRLSHSANPNHNPNQLIPGVVTHSHVPNPPVLPRPIMNGIPISTSQPILAPYFTQNPIIPGQFYPIPPMPPLSNVSRTPNTGQIPAAVNQNANMFYFNGTSNGVATSVCPQLNVHNPNMTVIPNTLNYNMVGLYPSRTTPLDQVQHVSIKPKSSPRNLETGNSYSISPHDTNTDYSKNASSQAVINTSLVTQSTQVATLEQTTSYQKTSCSTYGLPDITANCLENSLPALIPDCSVQPDNAPSRDQFITNQPVVCSSISQGIPVTLCTSPVTQNDLLQSSPSTEALSPNAIQKQVMNTQIAEKMSPPPLEPITSLSITSEASAITATPSVITSHTFEGKGISCVNHTPNEPHALLEAVQKLYFKDISLDEFQFVIQQVLQINTSACTLAEERAFVAYYELPTPVLNSNKLIKLSELRAHFCRLKFMFQKKTDDDRSSVSSSCTTPSPANDDDQSVPHPEQLTDTVRVVCVSDTEDIAAAATADFASPNKRRRVDDYPDVIIIE